MTRREQRERMVDQQIARRGISDPAVLAAFTEVPREAFVPESLADLAHADAPLPIAGGQTISQPYVVAITVQALGLKGHENVLEIGTGSGYAAAILGKLARQVHTVERIPELADIAAERLARLGFHNVHVHYGDGTLGWPTNAPYQAIAVAAGAPRPPPSLLQQLTIGGRIVLPHGDASSQRLVRITRRDDDHYIEENLGEVRFVPLLGAEGWPVQAN
jgi:protein-L-isoaspartate(D-aspartate) O-methyltransferase